MAQLVRDVELEKMFSQFKPGTDINTYLKSQREAYEKLVKSGVEIVRFPRGDGYALYVVKSRKPLRLAHVPFGDAWHIDAATMRGLRLSDIEAQLKQERALNAIFGGKKEKV